MLILVLPLANVFAQNNNSDPAANPWVQFGILGLIIVGILYLKVIVPGWVYQAEVERSIKKDKIIEAMQVEIDRLRGLAEEQTIPLLQRMILLVEQAEESWKAHCSQLPQGTSSPGSRRDPESG